MGTLINFLNAKFVSAKGGGRAFAVAVKGGAVAYPKPYSEVITIRNVPSLSTPLTNFPFYVDLSTLTSKFWNVVTSTGGDIRVYLADGITPVAREVVSCNLGTSATGTLPKTGTGELWIKAPVITSGSVFVIKVDGISAEPAANSPYGAKAVWSEYSLVSHDGGLSDVLGNVPDLSAWVQDPGSSPATYTLTPNRFQLPQVGPGVLGAEGSSYFAFATNSGLRYANVGAAAGQLSLWAKPGDNTVTRIIADARTLNNLGQLDFSNLSLSEMIRANAPGVDPRGERFINGARLPDGALVPALDVDVWSYVVMQAATGYPRRPLTFSIGQGYAGGFYYTGLIDEVRVCDIARSPEWIAAEYLNQINTGGFYTTAPRTFTVKVDRTKVPSNLTDFPLFIDLASMPSEFWPAVGDGGGGIRCFDQVGTQLAREVVSCDTRTKTGELYVKCNLSSTADTFISINVDGQRPSYAPTDPYGRNAVWSNGFVVVSHDGGKTDSTANGFNGAITGTVGGQVAGKLGATSQDYLSTGTYNLGSNSKLQSTVITASAWVKSASANLGLYGIVSRQSAWILGVSGGKVYGHDYAATNGNINGGPIVFDNTWHHIALTFQSGVASGSTVYSDGTLAVTGTLTQVSELSSVSIGGTPSTQAIAVIDEVRVANVIRNQAWISAEYANQNSPNTFYAITG